MQAIRLQGPLSSNGTGRVEVFYNGIWGTICDDFWDIRDAQVVCRQLGYQKALQALQGYDVPSGSGQIWLDDVDCTGNERNLAGCSHRKWGVHNCVHSEDAGVKCIPKGKFNYLTISLSHQDVFGVLSIFLNGSKKCNNMERNIFKMNRQFEE